MASLLLLRREAIHGEAVSLHRCGGRAQLNARLRAIQVAEAGARIETNACDWAEFLAALRKKRARLSDNHPGRLVGREAMPHPRSSASTKATTRGSTRMSRVLSGRASDRPASERARDSAT